MKKMHQKEHDSYLRIISKHETQRKDMERQERELKLREKELEQREFKNDNESKKLLEEKEMVNPVLPALFFITRSFIYQN
jgi:ATP adenylyltransferase/5',5'''-P-1,P-4-tetraphosphate phosphorylase II